MGKFMAEIKYPIKCISYCASNYGTYDRANSFEFWVRGHLIRIVGDKPFSRGDMIWLDEIDYDDLNEEYIVRIRVIDEEPYEEGLPVLSLATSRIVYSSDDFDVIEKDGVKVLKTLSVQTDDSYSLAFISLLYGHGVISCKSKSSGAAFNLDFKLSWKK